MKPRRTLAAGIGIAGLLATAVPAVAEGNPPQPDAQPGEFLVDTPLDTQDKTPGDGICADALGSCSLRAAVQEANASGAPTHIRLAPRVHALTIGGADEDAAATGDLDVTGTVTITARGAHLELFGLGDRAFDVAAGASLEVTGLSVSNGAPPETESGGAFRSEGTLHLDWVGAHNNIVFGSGASGGAIANIGGDLVVSNSELSYNEAARAGGAIEAVAGSTTIHRSSLHHNATGAMPGNGGAFHLTDAGTVMVTRSSIEENRASAEGGGLWNSGSGTMVVLRTEVRNNVAEGTDADQGGGGIFNDGGSLVVKRSVVTGNTAEAGSGSGGGILNNDGALDVRRSSIDDNVAARAGGGIETVGGTVSIIRSSLNANETGPTPGNGGGFHVSGPGTVDIRRSIVRDNAAANEGGGLWNSSVGTMKLWRTRVIANEAMGDAADEGGGGIFNQGNADGTSGGDLTIKRSKIAGNDAVVGSASGGGILNEQGTLTVFRTRIVANESARAGGGIEVVGGTGRSDVGRTEIDRSKLARNLTGDAPGNGGALHLTGTSTVVVSRSDIEANEAANEGGGLWNSPTGTMVVTDTEFERNEVGVAGNGPDVFQKGPVAGGTFTVDGMAIAEGPNDLLIG